MQTKGWDRQLSTAPQKILQTLRGLNYPMNLRDCKNLPDCKRVKQDRVESIHEIPVCLQVGTVVQGVPIAKMGFPELITLQKSVVDGALGGGSMPWFNCLEFNYLLRHNCPAAYRLHATIK